MLRVVPHAPDEARSATRLPRKAEEVDAALRRNAAPVLRTAALVEDIQFQPAVVRGEASGPDDGGDLGLCQVEIEDRVGDTFRLRLDTARFGIFRQVDTVLRSVSVRLVEQRHIVGIAAIQVGGEDRQRS